MFVMNLPTRRTKSIATVLIAMTVVAGCANESKRKQQSEPATTKPATAAIDNTYARELQRIDDGLDGAMGALFGERTFLPSQIAAAKRELSQAAKDLEAIDPPAPVEDAHAKYLAGVRGFGPIIDKLAAAQGDPEKIRAHLSDPEYGRVISNLQEAKAAFKELGYEL